MVVRFLNVNGREKALPYGGKGREEGTVSVVVEITEAPAGVGSRHGRVVAEGFPLQNFPVRGR